MQDDVASFNEKFTWYLVLLSTGEKLIGCRWFYKVKLKSDGTIERYNKSRLVGKGFTQSHGIDYFVMFSPVPTMNTVRIVLTLTSIKKWTLHQIDVHNACLQG